MDIGKAFGYVFEDIQWTNKILLGSVILLIPIFGPIVLTGYIIAIMRNVVAGDPYPLPDWSNIGENFMDGLMVVLANLIYGLPMILLSFFSFLIICVTICTHFSWIRFICKPSSWTKASSICFMAPSIFSLSFLLNNPGRYPYKVEDPKDPINLLGVLLIDFN